MDLREIPLTPFERHPWEVARAEFFVGMVRQHVAGDPIHVLDIGGGDGYVGRRLLEALPTSSRVTCIDLNYTDQHIAQLRANVPEGLTFSRTYDGESADWLLLLDVLEHVVDDNALLRSFSQNKLRPSGHVLLSVPAWPSLFTQHDIMLGHYRRYRPGQLGALAERVGLEKLDEGSLFSSLLLPRAVAKISERCRGINSKPLSGAASDHATTDVNDWKGSAKATAAITWALRSDARMGTLFSKLGVQLPGLSVWCLARQQPNS